MVGSFAVHDGFWMRAMRAVPGRPARIVHGALAKSAGAASKVTGKDQVS